MDIDDMERIGLVDRSGAEEERTRRRTLVGELRTVLTGRGHSSGDADHLALSRMAMLDLAGSDAAIVLVNLEDAWGERRRQNLPGTGIEEPNWRRVAARSFEEFRGDAGVRSLLEEVDRERRRESPPAEADPHTRARGQEVRS